MTTPRAELQPPAPTLHPQQLNKALADASRTQHARCEVIAPPLGPYLKTSTLLLRIRENENASATHSGIKFSYNRN